VPHPEGGPCAGAAHVFVDDVGHPDLSAEDRHHLERVLRLRSDEKITVGDGAGRWRWCRLGGSGGPLSPLSGVFTDPRPEPTLTVALALTKGHRPELAVQKLTEIGIDRIALFSARRSVARWNPERAIHHLDRLRRVAREAASQSRRVWLPVIEPVVDFEEVAGRPGAVMAERNGRPLAVPDLLVMIGPEGGWDPAELESGPPQVGLGPGVLRAETAALAAGVILCGLRAGIISPPDSRHSGSGG